MKHERPKVGKRHERDGDIWLVEGVFKHHIYRPRGEIGGCVIDSDGVMVQFVFGHGANDTSGFKNMAPGQIIKVEGIEARPWPAGDDAHAVYHFKRLVHVNGAAVEAPPFPGYVEGKIVRMNYTRHGEPNGFVLDSGHFVHLRPDRFAGLGIRVGAHMRAIGPGRPLLDGSGLAIDAVEVNGKSLSG